MSPELLVGIVATVVGIVAIVLTITLRRTRKPRWAIRTTVLIRDYTSELSDLEIRYSGHPVKNLSVSNVMFWNAGKETIRAEDIAPANPIVIKAPTGTEILNVQELVVNNPSSRLTCHSTGARQSVSLTFDFLDRGQGTVLQVIHTGTSSEDISVEGEVMGAGPPERRQKIGGKRQILRSLYQSVLFGVAFGVGAAILAAASVVVFWAVKRGWSYALQLLAERWAISLSFAIWGSIGATAGYYSRAWLTPVPKGLELFLRDIALPSSP